MIQSVDSITATAPSNIALIKYMGKMDTGINKPTNSSVSLTLPGLQTKVILSRSASQSDILVPLNEGGYSLAISQKGSERFLQHLANLKNEFGFKGNLIVQSGNNFPSDCGVASSASSFAALTKAFFLMLERECNIRLSVNDQALWSSKGSGSSGRSFFENFGLWKDGEFEETQLTKIALLHDAVLVSEAIKTVSSSQAHRQVTTSMLFQGRADRADQRLASLTEAFSVGDWKKAFEVCWAEFWDMHALFETSNPSFGYMTSDSITVLNYCRSFWREFGDGPLVTMDAGPNVHVIWRGDQASLRENFLIKISELKFKTISGISDLTNTGGGN